MSDKNFKYKLREIDNIMNKIANSPIVREFTGVHMNDYLLISLKGKASTILTEHGLTKEEILNIFGHIDKSNLGLLRRLVTKKITPDTFLWKVTWDSQSKKFEKLHRSKESKDSNQKS